jgi:hypothetical protein
MKNATEIKSLIEALVPGKTTSIRDSAYFVQVRPPQAGRDTYEVECGWNVSEAHDDDYMSFPYSPFKSSTPRPWVGRQIQATTSQEAADIYVAWREAVTSRNGASIRIGTSIGSVVR